MAVEMRYRWMLLALILLAVVSAGAAAPAPDPTVVRATIGGVVTETVAAGDTVEEGAPLVFVRTATKASEVAARAPRNGVVAEVMVSTGVRVRVGDVVVRFQADR